MAIRTYHPRGQLVDGYRCRFHPTYVRWCDMLRRCYNPADAAYRYYGERGITVDPEWHHFRNFARDMGIPPDLSLTLERKDNDRGYSKENCVWATRSQQALNRRTFKSNSSGRAGVIKLSNVSWTARFDYEGVRYIIGRFATKAESILARDQFESLFLRDKEQALQTLVAKEMVVSLRSTTKYRGVTRQGDRYIARCTLNGVRHYVGFFSDPEEAKNARAAFIESKTRGTGVGVSTSEFE